MHSAIGLRASVFPALIVFTAAASTAMAASDDDACSLVTTDQVSAAVKTAVSAGTYVMPTFKKTCTWTVTHPVNAGVKIVTLSFEKPEMFASGLKSHTPGYSTSQVAGIGDGAYFLTVANFVSLHVTKGGVALKVAVYAQLPPDQIQAMEKALAGNAVRRL